MMSRSLQSFFFLCLLIGSIAPALGDLFIDLRSPTGLLGTRQTYTGDGITTNAYGFDCFATCEVGTAYSPTELWADSVTGLGIASDSDHHISLTNFVMFDWDVFQASATRRVKFLPFLTSDSEAIGSFVYFSNNIGQLEVLGGAGVLQDSFFGRRGFRYIAFTGREDSGLPGYTLTNIVTSIPEPEIYIMLATGLGLLGWLARRKQ